MNFGRSVTLDALDTTLADATIKRLYDGIILEQDRRTLAMIERSLALD